MAWGRRGVGVDVYSLSCGGPRRFHACKLPSPYVEYKLPHAAWDQVQSALMSIEVEAVRQVTDELVEACRRLLPQLSSAAAVLDADELARIVDHQANTLLVARDQGAIVGMLTLVTFPLPSGLRARIEDVVVDQDARGRGAGTALTVTAIDLARQQGARNVDLTSRASRAAANRLYQRLGFQLRDSNVYRYQPGP
jgi:ribosomal protein S18 acetylase RimI-like enzyme